MPPKPPMRSMPQSWGKRRSSQYAELCRALRATANAEQALTILVAMAKLIEQTPRASVDHIDRAWNTVAIVNAAIEPEGVGYRCGRCGEHRQAQILVSLVNLQHAYLAAATPTEFYLELRGCHHRSSTVSCLTCGFDASVPAGVAMLVPSLERSTPPAAGPPPTPWDLN